MSEREILDHKVPGVCDFCSAPDTTWTYRCKTFIAGFVETADRHQDWGSKGDWAACQQCSEDIEAERWQAVLQRALDRLSAAGGVPLDFQSFAREQLRQLHAGFRRYRQGERELSEKRGPRPDDGLLVREPFDESRAANCEHEWGTYREERDRDRRRMCVLCGLEEEAGG